MQPINLFYQPLGQRFTIASIYQDTCKAVTGSLEVVAAGKQKKNVEPHSGPIAKFNVSQDDREALIQATRVLEIFHRSRDPPPQAIVGAARGRASMGCEQLHHFAKVSLTTAASQAP